MNIFVVLVSDKGKPFKIMTRARSSFHQRLCTYDTHEGAEKAISSMKHRFSDKAEFKIVEYGEIK